MATHQFAAVRDNGIEGTGLFATAPIRRGEVIWRATLPYRPFQTAEIGTWSDAIQARFYKYSIQIAADVHLGLAGGATPTEPFSYTNHSCAPNTWWADTGVLVARHVIAQGAEITYDYATSESHPRFGLAACRCGHPQCRKQVSRGDIDDAAWRAENGVGLIPYLRRTPQDKLTPWWQGGALHAAPDGLAIGEQRIADLVAQHGTPLYVYDKARIADQVALLRTALWLTGKPHKIHYAMKANRFGPVLAAMRAELDVGIDACSPREVALALESGFCAPEISVTASMLADRDLLQFAQQGVHLNLDSASGLRRYAAIVPKGTFVGLRVDPEADVGYGTTGKLNYCGGKLGLAPEDVVSTARYAAELGLVVDTLHMHIGWGIAEKDAPAVAAALAKLVELAKQLPTVRVLNLGGGLGARLQPVDTPLDPLQWGRLVGAAVADLDVTLACEPGTVLVSQAGMLVVQVNTVHTKKGQQWLGVDAGLGINVYAAHYAAPLSVLTVANPLAVATHCYNIAGNINEAADILARSVGAPFVQEHDLLAFFPAGAYGSSMASDHCLRGQFSEVLV